MAFHISHHYRQVTVHLNPKRLFQQCTKCSLLLLLRRVIHILSLHVIHAAGQRHVGFLEEILVRCLRQCSHCEAFANRHLDILLDIFLSELRESLEQHLVILIVLAKIRQASDCNSVLQRVA